MSTRQELRQEMEETRSAYHGLLAQVPDEAFSLPSDNPAWTIGQVLYHMSLAPRLLWADVRMITGQSWIYRVVPILVPKSLFDWLNARLTRYGARHLSRDFLAQEYDKAHAAALRALDSISDDDLRKQVHYPDWDPMLSGDVTVERLFHYVKLHFGAHAAQIRDRLEDLELPKQPAAGAPAN